MRSAFLARSIERIAIMACRGESWALHCGLNTKRQSSGRFSPEPARIPTRSSDGLWKCCAPKTSGWQKTKDAINEKIERAISQLDHGEGIPGEELRGRLGKRKAAWLAEQKR